MKKKVYKPHIPFAHTNSISFYVPSTRDVYIPISRKARVKRSKEIQKIFSKTFGGDTSVTGSGDYLYRGKVVNEKVKIVTSFLDKGQSEKKYLREVIGLAQKEKKRWGQKKITVVANGIGYFV